MGKVVTPYRKFPITMEWIWDSAEYLPESHNFANDIGGSVSVRCSLYAFYQ